MSSKPADRPRPPSVERVLAATRARLEVERSSDALGDVARTVIADERARLSAGRDARSVEQLVDEVVERLDSFIARGAHAVINATGVIIHTNLGRAPWAEVTEVMASDAWEYMLLEIDRETGRRGARFRLPEEHLIALTGAEDAMVTNNNA